MLKKIICAMLCLILCGSVFTGCTLIEHNNVKDLQQIVATVKPVVVKNDDGEVVFQSKPRNIYKNELNNVLTQNLPNYLQQNTGKTQEDGVNYYLDELLKEQLLIVEAERRVAMGELNWTAKEDAQFMDGIYTTIDNQLNTLEKEIYNDGQTVTEEEQEENTNTTTYPVKKDETTEEDFTYVKFDENGNPVYKLDEQGNIILDEQGNKTYEYIVFKPNKAKYPGMYGSEKTISAQVEAMRQLVVTLQDLVKDDFRDTKEDNIKFAEDDKKIAEAWKTGASVTYSDGTTVTLPGSAAAVYLVLGQTHYMEYLVGKSLRENMNLMLLQNKLTKSVTITDEVVKTAYDRIVSEQKSSYNSSASAYKTAVTGGTTTIYYNPNETYFYVKHILLPFSDKQTEELAEHAKDPKRKEFRDSLVDQTVVYEHIKGEDDKTNPKTVKAVFAEVKAAMEAVKSSPKEAERMFDDLIYKYNTDKGIFDKAMGYAVERNSKDNSGYMEEFYEAAMELYDGGYKVGEMLPTYAVTDYGVHIMYFASTVTPGVALNINSYQTPGQYKTYYDILKEVSLTAAKNKAYEDFSDTYSTSLLKDEKFVVRYEKRYKDYFGK